MSLGERIRNARDAKGLKQAELAKMIDVKSAAVISNWEKDVNKPDADKIIRLCEVLGISASYLLDYYGNTMNVSLNEQEYIKKYRTLDEYGKELVTAVIDIEYKRCTYKPEPNRDELIEISINYAPVSAGLGDELEDYEQWEKVSVPLTPESRKADFILRVDGDSMEPKFSNGDYLLVRKQPAVDIGQIGIFDVDGKGYVKKYGGDKLISLNPKYKDIATTDDSRCFGLVLGTTEIVDE
jgi:SOS-response transcriptional repressor LexA